METRIRVLVYYITLIFQSVLCRHLIYSFENFFAMDYATLWQIVLARIISLGDCLQLLNYICISYISCEEVNEFNIDTMSNESILTREIKIHVIKRKKKKKKKKRRYSKRKEGKNLDLKLDRSL